MPKTQVNGRENWEMTFKVGECPLRPVSTVIYPRIKCSRPRCSSRDLSTAFMYHNNVLIADFLQDSEPNIAGNGKGKATMTASDDDGSELLHVGHDQLHEDDHPSVSSKLFPSHIVRVQFVTHFYVKV
jgi:hypothetical protein